jgi:AcrR family transcriptional regulator
VTKWSYLYLNGGKTEPRQTFFNLPQEKRDHITRAAISHFVRHGYKHASITAIVAEAGIAKGSFYQYFFDKDDLYGYLIRLMAEWKMAVYRQEFHSWSSFDHGVHAQGFPHPAAGIREGPRYDAPGLDFVRSLHEPYAQKIYRDLSGVTATS